MSFDSIVGYTYNADNYCPKHVVQAMCERIGSLRANQFALDTGHAEWDLSALAHAFVIDREDERSFDSGDFPKVILSIDAISEDDDDNGIWADRCGTCHKLLTEEV